MTKRLSISLEDSTDKLIEVWRKKQSPIPSQNEAINQLVKAGLVAYQIQEGQK